MDPAALALAQEMGHACSFVQWLQPGAFRGSLDLGTGPEMGKARPQRLQGAGPWPKHPLAHWVLWPLLKFFICNKELNVMVPGDG